MKCIRQILVLVLCFPLLTVSGCKNSDSNFVGPWVGAALAPLLSPPILTIQSTFERSSQSRDILVEGDLYYVADGFLGLSVLQFTAYEKLIKIGRFLTQNGTGRGYSVAKSGDTVFLAVRDEGVYVLDVSDPENPVQLAGIATSSDASYVEVRNDLLYIRHIVYPQTTTLAPGEDVITLLRNRPHRKSIGTNTRDFLQVRWIGHIHNKQTRVIGRDVS